MTRSDQAPPLRLGLIGRAHGLGGAFRVVGAAEWYAVRARRDAAARRRAARAALGRGDAAVADPRARGHRPRASRRAALLGHPLELRASDAPAPEDDAFWVRDLVGMRARCGERELGEVTDVLERPANDVLVLRLARRPRAPRAVHARGGAGRRRAGTRAGAGGGVRRAARRVADPMLEIDVFTLFPHWFAWLSEETAVQRALSGPLSLRFLSYRDYSPLPHAQVDDAPVRRRRGHAACASTPWRSAVEGAYGGDARGGARGSGASSRSTRAGGASTTPTRASSPPASAITLLCGRYEGFDARVLEHVATESLSLGPFVLSGGEPVAMAVVDALARLLPGSLARRPVERGGVVRAGARGRARVPALHAPGGVARARRPRCPALGPPRAHRRLAPRAGRRAARRRAAGADARRPAVIV